MSKITDSVLFQADTTKKYDIPLSHLDYSYINECNNVKELEKILKILRSGDEGSYPHLEKACENKIELLNPKSRVLRKEVPLARQGDFTKEEWQKIDNELKNWETEMKSAEMAEKKFFDDFNDPELPPIRSGVINGHSSQEKLPEETKKNKRVTPRNYKEWDKIDIEKELAEVDKQEEKQRPEKKSQPPQIDTDIDTYGMTDEEKMMKAGREKDKGNEAFRAGDYEESIAYYTRSIKLHSTPASYNNRAIAYLKTSQWTNAAEDCNRVLKEEPENIKAFLRRGTAYKGMKEFEKSLKDFQTVLKLEPENKRAQDLAIELKEEERKFEEEKKRKKEKGRRMVIEEVDEESEDEIIVDKKPEEKAKQPEKVQVLNGHAKEIEKENIQEVGKSETKTKNEIHENIKNKNKKNLQKDLKTEKTNEKTEEKKNNDKDIWNEEDVVEVVSSTAGKSESENRINSEAGSEIQSESRLGFTQNIEEGISDSAESCEKQNNIEMGKAQDKKNAQKNENRENMENGINSDNEGTKKGNNAIMEKPVMVQAPLPSNVATLREEGNNLFKTGQYGDAVQKYTKAIEILGKDKTDQRVNLSLLYSNRAACYLKTGDCPHTIKDCTTALELVPHSIKPLLRRANAYEVLERYRPAYADYKHVLSIDFSVDMALQGSSRCQKHLIDVDGSKWREKLPRVPSVQSWEIPQIVDSSGQSVTSATPVTPKPINSSVTSSSASSSSSSSQSQPISNSVSSSSSSPGTKATEKQKSPEELFESMKTEGNNYVKKGQYEEARSCYTKCINISPDKVVSYTNRSLCCLKLNKPGEAEEDCTKALSLEKDNVKALFRRAQARKSLKNYKESLEDLAHLLKVDSKNTAAKKEMDEVKALYREELNNMKKQMEKPVDSKPRKRIVIEETDSEEEEASAATTKDKPKNSHPKPTQKGSKNDQKHEKTVTQEKTTPPVKPEKTTPPKKQGKTTQPVKQEKTPQPTKETPKEKPASQEPPKDQKKTAEKSKSALKSSIKPTSFGLPQMVPKLEKATPYEFISAWNALKQSTDLQPYADLLRQIPPAELPKVISNKLDGSMLSKITKCVAEKYTSPDDLSMSYQILENISKVPRFDTIAMFMSKSEKKDIDTVFSKVEGAGNLASKEEITRLRKKYSL